MLPCLSLESLNALASKVRVLLYSERPDACKSNRRKQHEVREQLAGNVLIDTGTCAAHAVRNIVEASLRDSDVVGDTYSIQYVIQIVLHLAAKGTRIAG